MDLFEGQVYKKFIKCISIADQFNNFRSDVEKKSK